MQCPLGVSPSRPSPSPTGGGGRDERSGTVAEGVRPPSAEIPSGLSCPAPEGPADTRCVAAGLPVTPAGYHRGQNPNEDQIPSIPNTNQSIIPQDILERIRDADEDGQVVHDEIGLDGITLTSKEDGHDEACHILADHGFIISPRDSGVKWYRKAYDIEGGGIVGWDYRGEGQSWIVELPGEQWMRDHERCLSAAFDLSRTLPMRCTRVDIRRDQYGRNLRLIENIGESCRAGELRRVRQFRPMHEHPARSPASHLARGWYLGSTKSERFVRVYDKGLERGLETNSQWERFEVETRKELAEASWREMVAAGNEWHRAAFEHLVGVVDFRSDVCRHAMLRELNRPEWWVDFCGGIDGVRPTTSREPTDALGFVQWMYRCAIPTLESVRQRLGMDSQAQVWAAIERKFNRGKAGGSPLVVNGLIDVISASSTIDSESVRPPAQAGAA